MEGAQFIHPQGQDPNIALGEIRGLALGVQDEAFLPGLLGFFEPVQGGEGGSTMIGGNGGGTWAQPARKQKLKAKKTAMSAAGYLPAGIWGLLNYGYLHLICRLEKRLQAIPAIY